MRRPSLFLLILLSLCTFARAQINTKEVKIASTNPSGSCGTANYLIYNEVGGGLYGCKAGTWTVISGGGGGGATIPLTTNLIDGDGAGNGADTGIPSTTPYSSVHAGGSFFLGIEYCRDDTFTVTTDFTAAATSQQVKMFTAAAFWSPRAFRVIVSTAVTSGSGTVTAVAASVGTVATPSGYVTSYAIFPTPSPAFQESAGGTSLATADNATQDVYLQLAVTNTSPGNLSSLTGGVIKVRSCGTIGQ